MKAERRITAKSRPPLIPPKGWRKLEPLVARRRKLGLRLMDIAAAMSVHYDFVGKLERGATPVTPAMLERYRTALNRLMQAQTG